MGGDDTSGVALEDFYAVMPMHGYMFAPTREMWPAASVNARIPPIPVANGKPISASLWLDRNRPVEQLTWSPGLPMIVHGRLMADGGWFDRDGVRVLNLYRPPIVEPGEPAKSQLWREHVVRLFGESAGHIISWLAHRVQHPQDKINHALVLGGAMGIGKDTLLSPIRDCVGPWNFHEITPAQVMGRFNGYLKSVILRISEARDLGEFDRFKFFDHTKNFIASPPETPRVDEKHIHEYSIVNCCGVVITTNHKSDGIYLPADDRRHYVAWSDLKKEDFPDGYWNKLYGWYANGGIEHVAAYLTELDLSGFDPKAPPEKTAAFWEIVDAGRAPEDAELADVLDKMGNPVATTLTRIANEATGDFEDWIKDRKNRRQIPYRLERCGYSAVRNDAAESGLWVINGTRQVIYARSTLSVRDRHRAAHQLASGGVQSKQ